MTSLKFLSGGRRRTAGVSLLILAAVVSTTIGSPSGSSYNNFRINQTNSQEDDSGGHLKNYLQEKQQRGYPPPVASHHPPEGPYPNSYLPGHPPPDALKKSSFLIQTQTGPSTLQGVGPPTHGMPGVASDHHRRSFTMEEAAKNPPEGPYFVIPQETQITTRAGQAAALTCMVKQLGDRQVSWIRGRDLHVLSSGQITFSSDSRVSMAHVGDSWTLTIRYTQPRDAGSYACQINTQPRIATWYNLTVIETRANIQGKETLYVQSGSTVTLECIIKEELVIPGLVLWYQDDRLVDRESGRVKVVTKVSNVTVSTLTVAVAESQDSGNYSCWPSAGRPDSVIVHVIQGDPPAAMQHGNSASGFSTILLIPTNIISLLFLLT